MFVIVVRMGMYVQLILNCEDNTTTSTTYDRPWTTPKNSRRAKFISGSYISRKQFTSYLKKFNVNPEANHPVYNHQYMANLLQPAVLHHILHLETIIY